MREKDVIHLLIRTFYTPDKVCLPNIQFGGGEADLLMINPDGRAYEYEVKLTRKDWWADIKKDKWNHPDRKYVSKFYYCVPKHLLTAIPDFVNPSTGIIVIDNNVTTAKIHKEADKLKNSLCVSQRMLDKLYLKAYNRYIKNLISEAWE